MADWVLFALGAAFFAGLTAVLAKIGVEGVPASLATMIRTAVILVFTTAVVFVGRQWTSGPLSRRSLVFLCISGITTGLSWLCYFNALQRGPASIVAPLDKLSVVVAIGLAVIFLGERLSPSQWAGASLIVAGAVLLAIPR